MSTELYITYYLKAFDAYPFDLTEVEEQLNYALAYNPNHVASLCLKSHYYLYELKWQNEARELAEQAMAIDPKNSCAAASLLNCMIESEAYNEAIRFLAYIDQNIAMNKLCKYAYMAYLMELKLNFNLALNYYESLLLYARGPEQLAEIEGSIKAVKEKRKSQRRLKAKQVVKS